MVVQEPSKALRGGVVVEPLPGPVVEAGCNIREVLGSLNGQGRVLRKVLAQQPIGVFISFVPRCHGEWGSQK